MKSWAGFGACTSSLQIGKKVRSGESVSYLLGKCFGLHVMFPLNVAGHFEFGKYIDSIMQSRVTAMASRSPESQLLGVDEDSIRASIIAHDPTRQKLILLAMSHYAIALKLSSKHVYQALPRLLALWFEFTSAGNKESKPDASNEGTDPSGE